MGSPAACLGLGHTLRLPRPHGAGDLVAAPRRGASRWAPIRGEAPPLVPGPGGSGDGPTVRTPCARSPGGPHGGSALRRPRAARGCDAEAGSQAGFLGGCSGPGAHSTEGLRARASLAGGGRGVRGSAPGLLLRMTRGGAGAPGLRAALGLGCQRWLHSGVLAAQWRCSGRARQVL